MKAQSDSGPRQVAAQVMATIGSKAGPTKRTQSRSPEGEVTSFPKAVKRKEDETVVFAWIEWPSRAIRDEGIKKVTEDPRMQPDAEETPFDAKRMIYGGFEGFSEL